MATIRELQDLRAQKRQQFGQRVADLPSYQQDLRQQTFGQDQMLPQLRKTKDEAIMELWETDKRLAQRYSNPESEMFIRDPYQREQIVSGQHRATLGTVSDVTRLEEARKDVLGDALERGMALYELGLNALRQEHSMLGSEIDDLLRQGQSATGPTTAEILKYLATQQTSQQPGTFEDLSPEQKFKARVLSGAADTPAPPPPEVPFGTTRYLGSLLGIAPEGQTVFPETEVTPEALRQVLPEPEELGREEALSMALEQVGLTGPQLEFISQYPDYDRAVAESLLQRLNLLPGEAKEDYTDVDVGTARSELAGELSRISQGPRGTFVNENGELVAETPEQLYLRFLQEYPELSEDQIAELLTANGIPIITGI